MSAAAVKRKEEAPKKKVNGLRMAVQSKPTAKSLWVDWDFLRSLTKRPPQTLLPRDNTAEYNRLLKLADIALGIKVERRKSEARLVAFQKAPTSKKRKTG